VLLANTARSVLGVDYSEAAVATARRAYARPNLEFATSTSTSCRASISAST